MLRDSTPPVHIIRDLELTKLNTLPILHHPTTHCQSRLTYYQALYTKACHQATRRSKLLALLRKLYVTYDSPALAEAFAREACSYSFSHRAYFEGFFANSVYFDEIRSILLQEYTLRSLNQSTIALQQHLRSVDSVFVHIRRGDYLAREHWEYVKLGGAYYNSAIRLMRKKLKRPVFFIFSDDLQWCKIALAKLDSTKGAELVYVGNNDQGDAVGDLALMTSCRNAIIANSTFSFWGAYLIDNPDKVIIRPAQYLWRGDTPPCYPTHWHKLDVIWGEIVR